MTAMYIYIQIQDNTVPSIMAEKEHMTMYSVNLTSELLASIRSDAEAHNTTAARVIRKILNDHYGLGN